MEKNIIYSSDVEERGNKILGGFIRNLINIKGGSENINTGNISLDKLVNYELSSYSKAKIDLIRKIANILAEVLKIPKDFSQEPIEIVIQNIKKMIPDVKSGKKFIADPNIHDKVCKGLAIAINKAYGETLININEPLENICIKVSEIFNSLFVGLHSEFIKITTDVTRTIDNITTLKRVIDSIINNIKMKVKESKDSSLELKIEEMDSLYKLISTELNRQITLMANIMNSVVRPTEESLISLLKDNKNFKNIIESYGNTKDSSFKFAEKISALLGNISLVPYIVHHIEPALKKIGMSIEQFKNINDYYEMKKVISNKLNSIINSNRTNKKEIKDFLKVADVLERVLPYITTENKDMIIKKIKGEMNQQPSNISENIKGGDCGCSDKSIEVYGGTTQSIHKRDIESRITDVTKNEEIVGQRYAKSNIREIIEINEEYDKRILKEFEKRYREICKEVFRIINDLNNSADAPTIYDSDIFPVFITALLDLDTDYTEEGSIQALTGYNNSMSAKIYRNKFLYQMNTIVKILEQFNQGLPYIKKLHENFSNLLNMVDNYTKIVKNSTIDIDKNYPILTTGGLTNSEENEYDEEEEEKKERYENLLKNETGNNIIEIEKKMEEKFNDGTKNNYIEFENKSFSEEKREDETENNDETYGGIKNVYDVGSYSTIKKLKYNLYYHYKLYKMKTNVRRHFEFDIENYRKDYENIMGDEVNELIKIIRDEFNERFKNYDKFDDFKFNIKQEEKSDLEIIRKALLAIQLKDTELSNPHLDIVNNNITTQLDFTSPGTKWKDETVYLNNVKMIRGIVANSMKMRELQILSQEKLLKTAESLDLFLLRFTKILQQNKIDDIVKLMNNIEMFSNWADNRSGDLIVELFESFPYTFNKSKRLTSIENNSNNFYKFPDINNVTYLKDNKKPLSLTGQGNSIIHYYKWLENNIIDNTNGNPEAKRMVSNPYNGILISSEDTRKNLIDKIAKSVKSLKALQNIINIFAKLIMDGETEIYKNIKYNPLDMYENLCDYIIYSSVQIGGGTQKPIDIPVVVPHEKDAYIKNKIQDRAGFNNNVGDITNVPKVAFGLNNAEFANTFLKFIETNNNKMIMSAGIYLDNVSINIQKILVDFCNKYCLSLRSIPEPLMENLNNNVYSPASTSLYGYNDENHLYETDEFFILIMKSIISKIFVTIGKYSIYNKPTFLSYSLSPLRTIIGGGLTSFETEKIEIINEISELYLRLPLLIEWYREIFRYNETKPNNVCTKNFCITIVDDSINDKFSGLIKLIFVDYKEVNDGRYNDYALLRIIQEINKIYNNYKSSNVRGKKLIEKIVNDLVNEINKKFGILKREEIESIKNYSKRLKSVNNEFTLYKADESEGINILEDTNYQTSKSLPSSELISTLNNNDLKKNVKSYRGEFLKLVYSLRESIDHDLMGVMERKILDINSRSGFSDNKIKTSLYITMNSAVADFNNYVKSSSTNKEKFIAYKKLMSIKEIMNYKKDSLVLFHELVVAPISVLKGIYEILKHYTLFVNIMDIKLWEDMIKEKSQNGCGGEFDINSIIYSNNIKDNSSFNTNNVSIDKYNNSEYDPELNEIAKLLFEQLLKNKKIDNNNISINDDDIYNKKNIIEIIKYYIPITDKLCSEIGDEGCNANITYKLARFILRDKLNNGTIDTSLYSKLWLRWGFDLKKLMYDLINKIAFLGSDLNGLVKILDIEGKIKPTLSFDGLYMECANLFNRIKYFINKFSDVIPMEVINKISGFNTAPSGEQNYGIIHLEQLLMERILENKDKLGLGETNTAISNIIEFIIDENGKNFQKYIGVRYDQTNMTHTFTINDYTDKQKQLGHNKVSLDEVMSNIIYFSHSRYPGKNVIAQEKNVFVNDASNNNKFPFKYIPFWKSGEWKPKSIEEETMANAYRKLYERFIDNLYNNINKAISATFDSTALQTQLSRTNGDINLNNEWKQKTLYNINAGVLNIPDAGMISESILEEKEKDIPKVLTKINITSENDIEEILDDYCNGKIKMGFINKTNKGIIFKKNDIHDTYIKKCMGDIGISFNYKCSHPCFNYANILLNLSHTFDEIAKSYGLEKFLKNNIIYSDSIRNEHYHRNLFMNNDTYEDDYTDVYNTYNEIHISEHGANMYDRNYKMKPETLTHAKKNITTAWVIPNNSNKHNKILNIINIFEETLNYIKKDILSLLSFYNDGNQSLKLNIQNPSLTILTSKDNINKKKITDYYLEIVKGEKVSVEGFINDDVFATNQKRIHNILKGVNIPLYNTKLRTNNDNINMGYDITNRIGGDLHDDNNTVLDAFSAIPNGSRGPGAPGPTGAFLYDNNVVINTNIFLNYFIKHRISLSTVGGLLEFNRNVNKISSEIFNSTSDILNIAILLDSLYKSAKHLGLLFMAKHHKSIIVSTYLNGMDERGSEIFIVGNNTKASMHNIPIPINDEIINDYGTVIGNNIRTGNLLARRNNNINKYFFLYFLNHGGYYISSSVRFNIFRGYNNDTLYNRFLINEALKYPELDHNSNIGDRFVLGRDFYLTTGPQFLLNNIIAGMPGLSPRTNYDYAIDNRITKIIGLLTSMPYMGENYIRDRIYKGYVDHIRAIKTNNTDPLQKQFLITEFENVNNYTFNNYLFDDEDINRCQNDFTALVFNKLCYKNPFVYTRHISTNTDIQGIYYTIDKKTCQKPYNIIKNQLINIFRYDFCGKLFISYLLHKEQYTDNINSINEINKSFCSFLQQRLFSAVVYANNLSSPNTLLPKLVRFNIHGGHKVNNILKFIDKISYSNILSSSNVIPLEHLSTASKLLHNHNMYLDMYINSTQSMYDSKTHFIQNDIYNANANKYVTTSDADKHHLVFLRPIINIKTNKSAATTYGVIRVMDNTINNGNTPGTFAASLPAAVAANTFSNGIGVLTDYHLTAPNMATVGVAGTPTTMFDGVNMNISKELAHELLEKLMDMNVDDIKRALHYYLHLENTIAPGPNTPNVRYNTKPTELNAANTPLQITRNRKLNLITIKKILALASIKPLGGKKFINNTPLAGAGTGVLNYNLLVALNHFLPNTPLVVTAVQQASALSIDVPTSYPNAAEMVNELSSLRMFGFGDVTELNGLQEFPKFTFNSVQMNYLNLLKYKNNIAVFNDVIKPIGSLGGINYVYNSLSHIGINTGFYNNNNKYFKGTDNNIYKIYKINQNNIKLSFNNTYLNSLINSINNIQNKRKDDFNIELSDCNVFNTIDYYCSSQSNKKIPVKMNAVCKYKDDINTSIIDKLLSQINDDNINLYFNLLTSNYIDNLNGDNDTLNNFIEIMKKVTFDNLYDYKNPTYKIKSPVFINSINTKLNRTTSIVPLNLMNLSELKIANIINNSIQNVTEKVFGDKEIYEYFKIVHRMPFYFTSRNGITKKGNEYIFEYESRYNKFYSNMNKPSGGLLIQFNRLYAIMLESLIDDVNGIIYKPIVEGLTNGVNAIEIRGSESLMDCNFPTEFISYNGIQYKVITYFYHTLKNSTTGLRDTYDIAEESNLLGDPLNPESVLFSSLAEVSKALLKTPDDIKEKKLNVQSIDELDKGMREKYKCTIPYLKKMALLLSNQCSIVKIILDIVEKNLTRFNKLKYTLEEPENNYNSKFLFDTAHKNLTTRNPTFNTGSFDEYRILEQINNTDIAPNVTYNDAHFTIKKPELLTHKHFNAVENGTNEIKIGNGPLLKTLKLEDANKLFLGGVVNEYVDYVGYGPYQRNYKYRIRSNDIRNIMHGGTSLNTYYDNITVGQVGYPSIDYTKRKIYLTKMVNKIKHSCFNLYEVLDKVHKDLNDSPLFFESYENSLENYKKNNADLPFMPLSNCLALLSTRHNKISINNWQIPVHKAGTIPYKFMFGTRGILGDNEKNIKIDHMPGIKVIIDKHNIMFKNKIDEKDVEILTTSMIKCMRMIQDITIHNTSMTSCINDPQQILNMTMLENNYLINNNITSDEIISSNNASAERFFYTEFGTGSYNSHLPFNNVDLTLGFNFTPFSLFINKYSLSDMDNDIHGYLNLQELYMYSSNEIKNIHDYYLNNSSLYGFIDKTPNKQFINDIKDLIDRVVASVLKINDNNNTTINTKTKGLEILRKLLNTSASGIIKPGITIYKQNYNSANALITKLFENFPDFRYGVLSSLYPFEDSELIETMSNGYYYGYNRFMEHINEQLGSILKTELGTEQERQKNKRVLNILDLDIVPINVHSLMKEISFVNLLNYSYTFDIMVQRFLYKKLYYPKHKSTIYPYDEDNYKFSLMQPLHMSNQMFNYETYKGLNSLLYGSSNTAYNQSDVINNNNLSTTLLSDTTEYTNIGLPVGVSNTLQMLAKMILYPYGYRNNYEYYNYISRIYMGEPELGLGRIKYCSDQLFNKILLNDIHPLSELDVKGGNDKNTNESEDYIMGGANINDYIPSYDNLSLANDSKNLWENFRNVNNNKKDELLKNVLLKHLVKLGEMKNGDNASDVKILLNKYDAVKTNVDGYFVGSDNDIKGVTIYAILSQIFSSFYSNEDSDVYERFKNYVDIVPDYIKNHDINRNFYIDIIKNVYSPTDQKNTPLNLLNNNKVHIITPYDLNNNPTAQAGIANLNIDRVTKNEYEAQLINLNNSLVDAQSTMLSCDQKIKSIFDNLRIIVENKIIVDKLNNIKPEDIYKTLKEKIVTSNEFKIICKEIIEIYAYKQPSTNCNIIDNGFIGPGTSNVLNLHESYTNIFTSMFIPTKIKYKKEKGITQPMIWAHSLKKVANSINGPNFYKQYGRICIPSGLEPLNKDFYFTNNSFIDECNYGEKATISWDEKTDNVLVMGYNNKAGIPLNYSGRSISNGIKKYLKNNVYGPNGINKDDTALNQIIQKYSINIMKAYGTNNISLDGANVPGYTFNTIVTDSDFLVRTFPYVSSSTVALNNNIILNNNPGIFTSQRSFDNGINILNGGIINPAPAAIVTNNLSKIRILDTTSGATQAQKEAKWITENSIINNAPFYISNYNNNVTTVPSDPTGAPIVGVAPTSINLFHKLKDNIPTGHAGTITDVNERLNYLKHVMNMVFSCDHSDENIVNSGLIWAQRANIAECITSAHIIIDMLINSYLTYSCYMKNPSLDNLYGKRNLIRIEPIYAIKYNNMGVNYMRNLNAGRLEVLHYIEPDQYEGVYEKGKLVELKVGEELGKNLREIGRARYDTTMIRTLEFFVNLQLILNLIIESELSYEKYDAFIKASDITKKDVVSFKYGETL